MGDAFLLERLIQNLVENGIQYNLPENGWVRVRTEARSGKRRAHRREHRPRRPGVRSPGSLRAVPPAGGDRASCRRRARVDGPRRRARSLDRTLGRPHARWRGGGHAARRWRPCRSRADSRRARSRAPNGHLMRRFVSRRSPTRRRDDDYPKTPPHPLRQPCSRGPRDLACDGAAVAGRRRRTRPSPMPSACATTAMPSSPTRRPTAASGS